MAEPRGQKIGVLDEYGSIWNGDPGSPGAQVIGDLVVRPDEETSDVYLGCDRCDTLATCKLTGKHCLHREPDSIEALPQAIASWEDWPKDVVERLREWNAGYLLSFPVGPDFRCEGGCGRMIERSPRGNPVVRATKKTPGSVVCEDCLISFARKFQRPPVLGVHGALRRLRAKLARQAVIMDGLVKRNRGLRQQIITAETYIQHLEYHVPVAITKQIRDALRGKNRRDRV